jgi:hypothetical protein
VCLCLRACTCARERAESKGACAVSVRERAESTRHLSHVEIVEIGFNAFFEPSNYVHNARARAYTKSSCVGSEYKIRIRILYSHTSVFLIRIRIRTLHAHTQSPCVLAIPDICDTLTHTRTHSASAHTHAHAHTGMLIHDRAYTHICEGASWNEQVGKGNVGVGWNSRATKQRSLTLEITIQSQMNL